MNEVINLLKSHRSIRKFQDSAIDDDTFRMIIEAAQCAPTSCFVQAYTIIRVNDSKKRKEIAKLAGDQKYVEECPLFLIFCADLNRLKMACKMNSKTMAEGYTESFIVATVDTALVAQNALMAAESLGLGGVYIGGIRNNPIEISELLNIPSNVYPVFGMCLGYPDDNPDIKPRLPLDIVLKIDEYNEEGDVERVKEYDSHIKDYYIQRTNGERSDTWTNQMANLMSTARRPHMRNYLDKQGFTMK